MRPARRKRSSPGPEALPAAQVERVPEAPAVELEGGPPYVRAWLQGRGIRSAPEELRGMLAEALEELTAELHLDSREELSAPELDVLASGGLDPEPRGGGEDPLARGAAEYAALLETALDVNAAAERAGVSATRIRQRLNSAPRSLVGVRLGGNWRVPLFQFKGAAGGLLPGLERVVEAIDADAHVLGIQSWFLGEHQDLVAGKDEERHLSPRDWLRLGRDPQRLVELAREL